MLNHFEESFCVFVPLSGVKVSACAYCSAHREPALSKQTNAFNGAKKASKQTNSTMLEKPQANANPKRTEKKHQTTGTHHGQNNSIVCIWEHRDENHHKKAGTESESEILRQSEDTYANAYICLLSLTLFFLFAFPAEHHIDRCAQSDIY